ncbi:DUF4334 domain-containing protein [Arthrobacter sp. YD2]|uniref:DUF4334 domain-containing protein n=1 Tax=Arthrobacter sp. YD2 TaxID=3058046 RepID=UPI0025B33BB0|nr:DUF4334 domain-containing protein [Arthrobacter sp. YD2]MDN3904734.1 DUF4334 domain-containing protein [Arthrobacter sp. YD2]
MERNPQTARRLRELQTGADPGAILAFFDALPPVTVSEMSGSWRGAGIPTGHPLDGLLEPLGWHGKRFDGPEDVFPLVFSSAVGLFAVNPAPVPLRAVLRLAPALRRSGLLHRIRPLLRLLRTRHARARLRMTEYRGVSSATMIYDSLPANDVFRRVDANTVLGCMDLRGTRAPYFFVLRRG